MVGLGISQICIILVGRVIKGLGLNSLSSSNIMDELINCVLYLSSLQKERDLDGQVITFHSHRTTEVVDNQH